MDSIGIMIFTGDGIIALAAPILQEMATLIERQRSSVFCLHENQLLAIELEDPTTRKRFWSLPGGGVETDETAANAAVRETLEETGYQVRLTNEGFATRYEFRWDGVLYDCTTYWFTAELASTTPGIVDDAAYLLGNKWLPWPKSKFLFANNPAYNEAFEQFSNI